MLTLQNITYVHPDKQLLFSNIHLTVNAGDKLALVGNNGSGKSTLLNIMAGNLLPAGGSIKAAEKPYYVPQHFGQYNHHTIAQALQIHGKLMALHEILSGNVTEANLSVLDDDWTIEEQCKEAFAIWGLAELDLQRPMGTLSGGQKTKVFLAGIAIHKPSIVLLDEPSNHMDAAGRAVLYPYIQSAPVTLVVVSHDRTLLNMLTSTCELSKKGITIYGGNYDFYQAQKDLEATALAEDLRDKEKTLRKAREVERETIERQQKLDARGKKKQEKAGLPTISMNTLRNNAEKSTSRIKDIHAGKTAAIADEVNLRRKELPGKDKMKLGFSASRLHTGKILFTANEVQYAFAANALWQQPLTFQVVSGQRIAIKGANGAGKTTLIKMLLGALEPTAGTLYRAQANAIYIDQDYSLVNNGITIYQQVQQYNTALLPDHEVKSKLTHFLFTQAHWDKTCSALSGGEKMRLILCCLTVRGEAPDLIVLDEPTNNLDIQNIDILTAAINEYSGTVIVVTHDAYFLREIGVEEEIVLG